MRGSHSRRLTYAAGLFCLVGLANAAAQTPSEAASGAAADRPRIGLVLSGGGARGAAHVGVLKALHELNVPIDLIVGTSMGAVVGGLYAAGLSPEQIEATLTTVDWQQAFRDRPARQDLVFRRKREDQNFLVRFPLGLSRGRFKLPRGLIQGQKLTQILRSLTLPVADVHDFDRFPTAFRAVATDLETGEQRVLASGDLTTAMRASLAAPGIFTPVEIDGRLLVDGGLSANLPIDVARAAGAERLIVVDVGFPLQTRRNLDSVASISNQMLAILIRRNSEMQRAQLTAADILITPPLGEASSFDFSNVRRSIEAGLSGARAQSVALQRFALPPAAYERWAAARNAPRGALPPIEFVRISSDSQRYAAALQAAFGDVVGRAPDASELATRVTRFYGRGDLDSLDYRWVRDDGRGGLELRAGRNPIGPNYVRFGLNLQDDFEGNSSFNAAARFVQTELTARGAEWTWDLQVGEEPNIATEYYLPIDASQRYFVMPRARFAVRTVPLLDDQRVLAEYRVRTTEFGLDIGREFGNWGELRFGTHWAQGSARLQIGAIGLPSPRFDVQQWFARFSYDRLDDVNFPRYGQSFTADWRAEDARISGQSGGDLVTVDGLIARSRGRNTGVLWVSAGTNTDSRATDPRTQYALGGFLSLSGLRADSLTGRHFAIARGIYYRQIGRAGPGFLDVPTYLGLSLELGNVWDRRRDISFGSARRDGSLFLGLDTLLGPVYLGAGFDDQGRNAFYLFLGRTF